MQSGNDFPISPDSIQNNEPSNAGKLFVGQVPKSMLEDELKKDFAPFGKILEIVILRDKLTGQHKGCAFVTFSSRSEGEAAINALHNKRTLTFAKLPMQVKFADSKNNISDLSSTEHQKAELKLFVGALHPSVNEDHLQKSFCRFGEIEEVKILRGNGGVSKCCGFVKFKNHKEAASAVEAMNGKTLDGFPEHLLAVRFAESDKPKPPNKSNVIPISIPVPLPNMMNVLPPFFPPQAALVAMLGMLPPQVAAALLPAVSAAHLPARPTGIFNQSGGIVPVPTKLQPYGSTSGIVLPISFTLQANVLEPYPSYEYSLAATTNQVEGPPDANLFIYHLPKFYTDHDLLCLFVPFGHILSARIFVDKQTGQSKCFGFVSYETGEQATAAIKAMNGYPLDGRRLKVQIKRTLQQPPGSSRMSPL